MKRGHLHLHTLASDGYLEPQDVIAAGLDFVAATDHDTLEGAKLLVPLKAQGVEVIEGVEVSLEFMGHHLHMVLLEPEPGPSFAELLAQTRERRQLKAAKVAADSTRAGVRLVWPYPGCHPHPTLRRLSEAAMYDPANAEYLQARNIAEPGELKRRFLWPLGASLRPEGANPEDVFRLVKGIAILAHPGCSLKLPESSDVVREFARRFPLDGLEVSSRKHTLKDEGVSLGLANELGLVPVKSNDVHKPEHIEANIESGETLQKLRASRAKRS